MKFKYLYQQIVSHIGVLVAAFLIVSLLFTHYVERLVFQTKVDELVSYGENILRDLTMGSYSSNLVLDQYCNVLTGRRIEFIIFDERGKILFPIREFNQDVKLADEVLDQISNGEKLVVKDIIKQSDQEVTLVALPYIMQGALAGGIFLTAPVSGSLEMIRQINEYLLVALLFAFVVAVVLSWILSRIHVIRIKRLQEATKKVSRGDYDVQVAASDYDEIGELSGGFNDMVLKLKESQVEIERLESRRRNFMSDVSHELRTPLTTISGVIEGLRNEMIAEEEREKGIRLVSEETKRLIRLVNENLDYDKIRSNQIKLLKEEIQLREVFEVIQEHLSMQAEEKNNRIEIEADEQSMVYADYDRLIQILINITKNSIQFTNEGIVTLRGYTNENGTVIEIKDTGVGIDPNEVEKIWQRFYKAEISRTSNPYGEFGLGLSIVRQLVHLHKGTIEVHSEKGKGTIFVITFPSVSNEK